MISRILTALHALRHGQRMRHELDEEMAFHVEALAEDLMRRGMAPDEARREARRRFGATERVHDDARRANGVALFDEVARNVRFAFRGMIRSPMLTGAFVLTLALCIGFGTAVFSTVDAMLWRPLPYPDADRLALAGLYDTGQGIDGRVSVDGPTWLRIRDEADGFQVAVYSGWVKGVNLSTDATSRFARQQRVSAGFFATLGVPPLIGREFTSAEDVLDGPPLAILSHGLWMDAFDGDPDILGGTIRLKGELHTVVGVMPDGFRSDDEVDVWTPLRASTTGEGSGTNYTALVRLPAGMTWEGARGRFAAIEPPMGFDVGGRSLRYGLVPLEEALSAGLRLPLLVLLGAVALMILVGCANLAGVQVSRALSREIEMSTRQALGSGTDALVRQLLTEHVILGAAGGVAGLVVARASLGGLAGLVRTNLGAQITASLDPRAFIVAVGLTVAATFVFGLMPVLHVRSSDALRLLVSGTRGVAGASAHGFRRGLIVGQVGVVTVLLFAAVLLARSYGHLARLEPGFDPTGITTVQLSLDDARYSDVESVGRLFDRTLEDLRGLPEVTGAAVALTLPYERPLNMPFRRPGDPEDARPSLVNLVYVTPTFFETLSIPVLDGRPLRDGDRADTPPVAVASRAVSDLYFDGGLAPGGRMDLLGQSVEIVGIVGDVQQGGGGWGSRQPVWTAPTVYVPVSQLSQAAIGQIHVWFSPSWIVEAPAAGPQLMARITQVFEAVDRDLPLARAASMEAVMAEAFVRTRFQAVFLLVVAGFALLLAGVGLYGIVAQEVLRRRREMGVRMALGASPRGAIWHAGLTGMRLAALGLLIGGAVAAAGGRVLASLAWGVSPTDPVGFVVLIVGIGGLTAVASFVPAARLGRLDPATVLRE